MTQERHYQSRGRRRNTFPLLMVGVGAVLLLGAIFLAVASGGPPEQADVTLQMLDGSMINLLDYRGQTVVLNFWATWCPPCTAEMPALNAYYQQHRDEDFVLLAVNAGESAEVAAAFIAANGFEFPVALDPDGRLTKQFGINGFPTTIVFDDTGSVRYRHNGLITPDVLEEQITPLLTES